MASGTSGDSDLSPTITVIPKVRFQLGDAVTFPCSCGKNPKNPPNLAGIDPGDTGFNIGCSQQPPGSTVLLEVPTGDPNTFICIQDSLSPESNLRVAAAVQSPSPSVQLPLGIHSGSFNFAGEDFPTAANGVLGVVALIAVGSTFWYRSKYRQAVSTNQSKAAAGKPKRQ